MVFAGVDGCRGGWLVVLIENNRPQEYLCPTIDEVSQRCKGASHVWIDMPIGFTDQGSEGRECDRLARRLLSPLRHSSVFTPPCRAALYAAPERASEINFQHTGKKLSKQSINIIPRMRELDQFLQDLPTKEQERWLEAHPEVAFALLNNGRPMAAPKRTLAGQTERLQLIEAHLSLASKWFEQAKARYPRKVLQPDDLLDAAALALASMPSSQGEYTLRTLPADPPRDATGLAMQIVFPEKG